MINKFSEAHERMLAQLEVRTHRKRDGIPPPPGKRKINEVRPIVVNGVQYPSITAARKTLRVGMHRVYAWLRDGKKATYA